MAAVHPVCDSPIRFLFQVVVSDGDLAEDWECAVCLDNNSGLEDVITASPCQHGFHMGCLARHAAEEVKKRCSVIRCSQDRIVRSFTGTHLVALPTPRLRA